MRHALVTVHLIHQARTATNPHTDERWGRTPLADLLAEDDDGVEERRSRRLATLARRARALAVRTT
jgi:hypothetical protein